MAGEARAARARGRRAIASRCHKSLTPSEQRLWLAIRGALGVWFRRQVPLGRFVGDFVGARSASTDLGEVGARSRATRGDQRAGHQKAEREECLRCLPPGGRLRSSGPYLQLRETCSSLGVARIRWVAGYEPSVGAARGAHRASRGWAGSNPSQWAAVCGGVGRCSSDSSGEGGIRTLGTLADTHDFQSCTFGHSVTSPGPRHASYPLARTGALRREWESNPRYPCRYT